MGILKDIRIEDKITRKDLYPEKEEKNKKKNQGGLLGGLGYFAGNIGTGIASVFENVGDAIGGTLADLTGNDRKAAYIYGRSTVGEWNQSLDEWYNPNKFMQGVGDVAGGVGQSLTYAGAAAIPGIGTGLSLGVIAASGFGGGVSSAYQKTGELGAKEYAYGALSGATELALEKFVGSTLSAGTRAAGQGASKGASLLGKSFTKSATRKGILKTTFTEASEEFLEEFASSYTDTLWLNVTGVDKGASTSLSDAFYNGMIGFFSGGLMSGASQGIRNGMNYSRGKRIMDNGNAQTMFNTSKYISETLGLDELIQKGESDKEIRKRLTDKEVQLNNAMKAYDALENKTGAKAALYLGEMQETVAMMETQAKAYNAAETYKKAMKANPSEAERYAEIVSAVTGLKVSANDIKKNKQMIGDFGALDVLGMIGVVGEYINEKKLSYKMKQEQERNVDPITSLANVGAQTAEAETAAPTVAENATTAAPNVAQTMQTVQNAVDNTVENARISTEAQATAESTPMQTNMADNNIQGTTVAPTTAEGASLAEDSENVGIKRAIDRNKNKKYNKRKISTDEFKTNAFQWARATKRQQGDSAMIYNPYDNTWNRVVADDSDEGYFISVSIKDTKRNKDEIKNLLEEVKNENYREQPTIGEEIHEIAADIEDIGRSNSNDRSDVEGRESTTSTDGLHRQEPDGDGKRDIRGSTQDVSRVKRDISTEETKPKSAEDQEAQADEESQAEAEKEQEAPSAEETRNYEAYRKAEIEAIKAIDGFLFLPADVRYNITRMYMDMANVKDVTKATKKAIASIMAVRPYLHVYMSDELKDNGAYWLKPNGEICIVINKNSGAVTNTILHEVTHALADENSKEYQSLSKMIRNHMVSRKEKEMVRDAYMMRHLIDHGYILPGTSLADAKEVFKQISSKERSAIYEMVREELTARGVASALGNKNFLETYGKEHRFAIMRAIAHLRRLGSDLMHRSEADKQIREIEKLFKAAAFDNAKQEKSFERLLEAELKRSIDVDNYTEKQYNELYTASNRFAKEIVAEDREWFSRSLANNTSDLKKGEKRLIVIRGLTKNNNIRMYHFEADGYMHGKLLNKKVIRGNKKHLWKEYKNGIDADRENSDLWFEPISSNGRDAGKYLLPVGGGRGATSNDSISEDTQKRDRTGYSERSKTDYRIDQREVTEIVKKLKALLEEPIEPLIRRSINVEDHIISTHDERTKWEKTKDFVSDVRSRNARENAQAAKTAGQAAAIKTQILTTNSQAGVEFHLKSAGWAQDEVESATNMARMGARKGEGAITLLQTDIKGNVIGDGLQTILAPIKMNRQDFNLYMVHKLNLSRAPRGKAVFDDLTEEMSRKEVARLEKLHPEFKEVSERMAEFDKNLLQLAVDAGLISQEAADAYHKLNPYYVTIRRLKDGDPSKFKSGAFRIKDFTKQATGGEAMIVDPLEAYIDHVLALHRSAYVNILANAVYESADGTDVIIAKDAVPNFDRHIDEEGRENLIGMSYREGIEQVSNTIVLFRDGEAVAMRVSDEIMEGFKALQGGQSYYFNTPLGKANTFIMRGFSKLVTTWNPIFILRNAVRDFQDAGIYSRFGIRKFVRTYFTEAIHQISTNGELWQEYIANGAFDTSILEYSLGLTKSVSKHSLKKSEGNVFSKAATTFENVQLLIEQLPRFTEYLLSRKAGNDVQTSLYYAADVTVNFGRSGKLVKAAGRTVMPFLNPAFQGLSKNVRHIKDATKSKNAAKKLLFSAVVLGIAPILLSNLMYGDDEEYEILDDNVKTNYYLLKFSDKFIRLPRGRLASSFATVTNTAHDQITKGEIDGGQWRDSLDNVLSQSTPMDSITRTIFSPILDVQTNTTWYGGQIESQAYDHVAPAERYDEYTSAIAKKLGEVFKYSPKKIDYLLDQYSGVIGDFVLPLTADKRKQENFLETTFSSLITDPTYSNKLSSEFYDMYDEVDWADDTLENYQVKKHLDQVKEKINELYDEIDKINEDESLSSADKVAQARVIRTLINRTYKTATEDYKLLKDAAKSTSKAWENVFTSAEVTKDNYRAFGLDKDDIGTFAVIYSNGVESYVTQTRDTEDDAEDYIDRTVKRGAYADMVLEAYGPEAALEAYSSDFYEKAQVANALGVDYGTMYRLLSETRYLSSTAKKDRVDEYLRAEPYTTSVKSLIKYLCGDTTKSVKVRAANALKSSDADEETKIKWLKKLK